MYNLDLEYDLQKKKEKEDSCYTCHHYKRREKDLFSKFACHRCWNHAKWKEIKDPKQKI